MQVTLAWNRECIGEEAEEGLEVLMMFSKEVFENVDEVVEAN